MFKQLAIATFLTAGIGFAGTLFAADEPAKTKEKEEKAPPKEKKSKIDWQQVKSATGTIKNTTETSTATTSNIPRNGKLQAPTVYVTVRPVRIDFSTEQPAWRIKWNVEGTTERGGKLKVVLYKEEDRGKSKDWKKKGMIPARVGTEGEQVFTLGPGNYYLELTGEDNKYEFTIEEAHKASQ